MPPLGQRCETERESLKSPKPRKRLGEPLPDHYGSFSMLGCAGRPQIALAVDVVATKMSNFGNAAPRLAAEADDSLSLAARSGWPAQRK
jgi:hypothetical protein